MANLTLISGKFMYLTFTVVIKHMLSRTGSGSDQPLALPSYHKARVYHKTNVFRVFDYLSGGGDSSQTPPTVDILNLFRNKKIIMLTSPGRLQDGRLTPSAALLFLFNCRCTRNRRILDVRWENVVEITRCDR